MRKFVRKFILSSVPLVVYVLTIIIIDPYHCFFRYDHYHINSRFQKSYIRELECKNNFDDHPNRQSLNSFIIGNSRSISFKIVDYSKYISSENSTFHFDASGMSLKQMADVLRYIERNVDTIKNLLLVIDHWLLRTTNNRNEILYLSHPEISGMTHVKYYSEMLKGSLDLPNIYSILADQVENIYNNGKNDSVLSNLGNEIHNKITGDSYWLKAENEILSDSLAYYHKREKIFYKRNPKISKTEKIINNEQLNLLRDIQRIILKHKISCNVVISPLYDQKVLDTSDLVILENIFGKEKVFNFSGINSITNNKGNYFESSHYRVHVAQSILNHIFNRSNFP